jgi:Ca2+/Na+ antiporter
MPDKTIGLGAALVALGVIVTIASGSGSATSLIPAFIGVVFLVLGLVARSRDGLRPHLMHGAAALALLAILGSLGSAIGRGAEGWALFAQIATIVLCAVFLFFAVQSFRQARLARESA